MNPDNEAVNAFDEWFSKFDKDPSYQASKNYHPENHAQTKFIMRRTFEYAWDKQQEKIDRLRAVVEKDILTINAMSDKCFSMEADRHGLKAKIDRLEALLREARDTLEHFKEDFDTRMNLTFTNEDVLILLEKLDQELGGKE